MFEECICTEYPCLNNISLLESMFKDYLYIGYPFYRIYLRIRYPHFVEYLCIEYPCLKNIFVLDIHVRSLYLY